MSYASGYRIESPEVKITILGGGGVGKSSIALRFVANNYVEEYDPTIEDSYRKQYVVDDKSILFDILDTAGQEEFSSMQDQWIREADIIILVYSMTSENTWDEVEMHYDKIQRTRNYDGDGIVFPVAIVGNKRDIPDLHRVKPSTPDNFVKDRENCFHMTVSAKEGQRHGGVIELFERTIRLYFQVQAGKSKDTAKKMKKSLPKPIISCNYNCCNCACFKISDWYHALKYEKVKVDQYIQKDKIQFFKNDKPPLPDIIPAPIYSLKNFKVKRIFNWYRFIMAIICGLFLPIAIILQTIVFLSYSEFREAKYYPKFYPYDDIHASIFYDFLGIVIGRRPGQDPETVKDRKWFLRQTKLQKLKRVFATIFITLISLICFYNITQVNNKDLRVSMMETIGPFALFWIVWLLLSLWIAYEIKLTPALPSPLRLRSVVLYLGERYKHVTSAYKFLRAYYASRDRKWILGKKRTILITLLGILYALIPGITRMTVGDPSDGLEEKKFITKRELIVSVGAIIVNFTMVTTFIYAIEVQYRKHFDNYKTWMYDITMLLHKDNSNDNTDNDDHYEVKKGENFSKHIFLSLTRRSNALGWLEIRSFLAVEGKILFAEQELPTSWMVLLTISLSIFILYRVYFIDGFPLRSILFNGCIMLAIICVVSLMRIAITGWKFDVLQRTQQRLLGEQKFFMRCHKQNVDDIQQIESPKLRKLMKQTHQDRYKNLSISFGEFTKDNSDKKKKTKRMNETAIELAETKTKPDGYEEIKDMEEQPLITKEQAKGDSTVLNGDTENKYEDVNDDQEDVPLLGGRKVSTESTLLMVRDSIGLGFIDDMLYIVQTKDIYPRLFGVKLNSVLAKAIAIYFFTGIASIFKLFIN